MQYAQSKEGQEEDDHTQKNLNKLETENLNL